MPSIAVAFDVPYQFWLQECAPVQALPGTRIRLFAPVARIAEMAWFAALTQTSVVMVWGSFISPKITRESPLNTFASLVQKSANCAYVTAPWLISVPL